MTYSGHGKKLFFNVCNFLEKTERFDIMNTNDKYRDQDAELLEEEIDNMPEEWPEDDKKHNSLSCWFSSDISINGVYYEIKQINVHCSIDNYSCIDSVLHEIDNLRQFNPSHVVLKVNNDTNETAFEFTLGDSGIWYSESAPTNDFEKGIFDKLNVYAISKNEIIDEFLPF